MNKNELEVYLNKLFQPELYDDYCPNGLQIDGCEKIQKISFSVSATKESIDQAVANKSHALIVHHGLFWKFHGTKVITGAFGKRVKPLIQNDINLFGYHLPLDGHLELGNAATLAKKIGLQNLSPFGFYKGNYSGIKGSLPNEKSASIFKTELETILNHHVLYSNPIEGNERIKTIGIITGGANSEWKEALKQSLDAYITGEMSEHDYHESRESGIHMFAGGHHATEKFGILELMKKIQNDFPKIDCEFIDSNNPA